MARGILSRPIFTDLGLLLIRVMVGVVGMFHGSQKLFGMFGGTGLKAFASALEQQNMPWPMAGAVAAGSSEFFGGLLVAIGLFSRLAAIPFAFTMFVAAFVVHGQAFSAEHGGMEYPLTLGVVLAGLVLTGPGRLTAVYAARGTKGG